MKLETRHSSPLKSLHPHHQWRRLFISAMEISFCGIEVNIYDTLLSDLQLSAMLLVSSLVPRPPMAAHAR